MGINSSDDESEFNVVQLNERFKSIWDEYENEEIDIGYNGYRDANILAESFYRSSKSSSFKKSIHKFKINFLSRIWNIQTSLIAGTYEFQDFYRFTINERGKVRHIRAQSIDDRVVNRDVSDNLIQPMVYKYLIYDNGASIKGKGISFSRRRLVLQLARYVHNYGCTGYVLQIDFKGFFDSIDHDVLLNAYRKLLDDVESFELLELMIRKFSDDKHPNRSLGIGSQISQLSGVYFPTRIDNYCTIVEPCEVYERFMDDIVIIDESKERLEKILHRINLIAKDLKLTIHPNKTHITPLNKGFGFLKIRYSVDPESHQILQRIDKDTISRERRKIYKYYNLFRKGSMNYFDCENSFKSWYGSYRRFHSRKSVHRIFRVYVTLFYKEIMKYSKDKKLVKRAKRTKFEKFSLEYMNKPCPSKI